ncbi:MAG: glycosyltransferase [Thermodesulfovibrionales bacterium]|nr:glycosyltransferase [Thermodesulfovibrionales bacterium]
MNISVIIPTLNAGRLIGQLLSGLLSQDLRPGEIIVIDSSSQDNTVDIAKKTGVSTLVIPRSTFNHSKTRNQAALTAAGDTLVFMTQDAIPVNNSLLRELTAPLQEPDIAATYARQIPRPDAPLLEVFTRYFNYPEKASVKSLNDLKQLGIKTFFSSNVCSSMKRELFIKAGMFPESVRANEDMVITAKYIINGYKVAYVPEAMVIHSHNYSLLRQYRRYYNIGSSIRENRWILDYAHAEGEGMKFIQEQIRFVVKKHKFHLIPYIFFESLAKFLGFRMGLVTG